MEEVNGNLEPRTLDLEPRNSGIPCFLISKLNLGLRPSAFGFRNSPAGAFVVKFGP